MLPKSGWALSTNVTTVTACHQHTRPEEHIEPMPLGGLHALDQKPSAWNKLDITFSESCQWSRQQKHMPTDSKVFNT